MNRKFAPLFMLVCSFLYACGGGSSSGGGNGGNGGGGTTPQTISVTFPSGVPPATLNAAQQTPLEANVANDSANAGVTWSCAPAGSCGSFSSASTSSGNPTTYTAPIAPPSGGSVTVTATSVTDTTKSAHASIAINGISIQFSQAPPSTLPLSGPASVSATVTNDANNAGVTWSCTPASSCGSFSAAVTPSGTATTYTAPSVPPTGGSVTITAYSVTDTSKSVQASVSITTNIAVSFSEALPATLATSSSAPVAATVTNDPANAGVNWSCAPAGSCGSFSPTTTPSGTATTYTAPPTVPSSSVTIIATSVSDPSKSTSATAVITGLSLLKGQYAFLVTSPTGNRNIATWIGSVNLDGAGNILGGIEEIASPIYLNDVADPILTSCPVVTNGPTSGYTVDTTGHGRLTMCTNAGETLSMSFVLTSSSHAEVVEADGFPSEGNPGSGTLDLQTPAASGFSASQINGSYSFTMSGADETTKAPLSFGGFFSSDGNSNIAGGQVDINNGTSFESDTVSPTSTAIGAPDTNGRGVLRLPVFSPGVTRQYVYYIVNSKVIRLIEADGNADMGGSAYIQPTTATSLGQNYIYQYAGWSSAGRTVSAGQFATSSGTISGTSDSSAGPTPSFTAARGPVTGSYAASSSETATFNVTDFSDASGSGKTFNVYFVDPSLDILDPNSTTGGGGALLLETDSSVNGTGVFIPQSGPTPFFGNYALNLNNSIAAPTPNELDLIGVLAADGSSSFGPSNLADYDQNTGVNTGNPMLKASLSGSFAADTVHPSRYTGSFTVTPPAGGTPYPFIPGLNPSTFTISIYQASLSQAFILQNDASACVIGRIVLQQLP